MSKTIMNKILASFVGAVPVCVIACIAVAGPLCCAQDRIEQIIEQHRLSTNKTDKIKTLLRCVKSGKNKPEIIEFFSTEKDIKLTKIKELQKTNAPSNAFKIAQLSTFVSLLEEISDQKFRQTTDTYIQRLAANIEKELSDEGLDQIYAKVTGNAALSRPTLARSRTEPNKSMPNRPRPPEIYTNLPVLDDSSASESGSPTSSTRSGRPSSIGSRSRSRSPRRVEAFDMYTPDGASRPAHEDASSVYPIGDYSAVVAAHIDADLAYRTIGLLRSLGLFQYGLTKTQKIQGLLYCMKNGYMESQIISFFVEHVNRAELKIHKSQLAVDSRKTLIDRFLDLIFTELPDAQTEELRQHLDVSKAALERVVSDMSRFDDVSIRLVASFIAQSMQNTQELDEMWDQVLTRLESDKDYPHHIVAQNENHAVERFDISDSPR